MTLFCELAGEPVLRASVCIPKTRIWTADLLLDVATAPRLTGKVALILAGLTLVGTVVRGALYQGQYQARMIGGAAGWRKTIPAKPYGPSPSGLKLGPIVKDAARECGEEVRVTDDSAVGEFFVRARDKASRVLDRVYPNWWIDETGVTRIGHRPSGTVTTAFDLLNYQAALGRYDIATEFPQSFMPGVRFASPTTSAAVVNLVTHTLSEGSLRTTVYAEVA